MREVRPLLAALCLLPLACAPALAAERPADPAADPAADFSAGASAPLASIDQIHALAAEGRVDQALARMRGVLREHPASARAHYVEAELYARESRLAQGRGELARAEQLAPGLPFADVYSVAELNRRLSLGPATAGPADAATPAPVQAPPRAPGWLTPGLIVAAAAVALGIFAMRRRGAAVSSPWQKGYPVAAGGFGSGMGSGLMGSLAGGAAMGAGFAAGEEAIDHLFGERRVGESAVERNIGDAGAFAGGDDFGISDAGSWDGSSTDDGGW